MNKKIFNRKTFYTVGAVFLSFTSLIGINASAAKTNNRINTHKFRSELSANKSLANSLKKQGYVYSINRGVSLRKNSYPFKYTYSKKATNAAINNKYKFRVKNIWQYRNGVEVNLTSKSKKYNTWVNFPTDLYYSKSRNKNLKPVVNFAKQIILHQKKDNKQNINQLTLMSKNIKSSKDRKLALQFVGQLKHYLNKNGKAELPFLLIGNMN
ncbi:hypothetical protein WR164_15920 [Philodulcilactobacillus myokoensis]|uniref:D-alanyl-D-alanine carboxypeptidase n=1 Tax=Philodulcilactobacillus myokoensis TaxID=2929573 RepID=A0A9W6B390_9LACO|nr:hypothetical protein [Philodulcilactobacillus myokoensis]GLB47613.1 hypothetical protein WR164_15920 [Philodulcilactobacillus myokoensis]